MTRILRLKLDVTKIDKARLFQGKKGTYLDATVFLNDEPGQFGDHGMITQDVSQEEREAGTKGAILGNATIVKIMDDNNRPASTPKPAQTPAQDENDDIPF